MYPGASHGIPCARNRLVTSANEMSWTDYRVRGNGKKISWCDGVQTLEDTRPEPSQRFASPEAAGGDETQNATEPPSPWRPFAAAMTRRWGQ